MESKFVKFLKNFKVLVLFLHLLAIVILSAIFIYMAFNNPRYVNALTKKTNLNISKEASSLFHIYVEGSNKKKTVKEEKKSTLNKEGKKNENDLDLSKCMFVGNSIIVGLERWGDLGDAKFCAIEGLNVTSYYSKGKTKLNERPASVYDVVKASKFDKVFLMFGINEIGWPSRETFIKRYRNIIKEIKKDHSKATIVVQSVMYVTDHRNKTDKSYNNKKIDKLNEQIKKMAEEEGVIFLDENKFLASKNKALPDEAASDGMHLTPRYCKIWGNYLKNEIKNMNKEGV